MKTRPISTLQEVQDALNFDRFTVVNPELNVNIDAINDFLSHQNLPYYEKAAINKQLGTYCLFKLRDKQQALQYLNLYRDLLKGYEHSEDYAEACNLIGHAETIDGGYQNLDEFSKALDIYSELKEESVSVTLGRAFALRYYGLMLHRKGHLFLAADYLQQALILQQKCLPTNPGIHADIAETLHILGVIAVKQGNLLDGKEYFEKALKSWADFKLEQGYLHPIYFNTLQSLGSLFSRLILDKVACVMLEGTYKEQVEYYGTTEQADVAKTLHFLGDALKVVNPADALEKYLEALKIKAKLFGETSPIFKVTQKAIHDVLPEVIRLFPYDWNDASTIAPTEKQLSNILTSLKMVDEEELKKNVPGAHLDIPRFYYNVATYYLHVKSAPDVALDALYKARRYWKSGWLDVQKAFAYQQKMAACNKEDNAALLTNYQSVMHLVNLVIRMDDINNDPKLLAYAYCVKALAIYECKDVNSLEDAIKVCKMALHLLPDDQFANRCYKDFKKNLPEGYNPKVFKAAPPEASAPKPKNTYGLRVG